MKDWQEELREVWKGDKEAMVNHYYLEVLAPLRALSELTGEIGAGECVARDLLAAHRDGYLAMTTAA